MRQGNSSSKKRRDSATGSRRSNNAKSKARSPHLGLYLTGPASRCSLAGLPGLLARIGPIGARNVRQATRFANSHRVGYAVRGASEFAGCRALLVCYTAGGWPDASRELLQADLSWTKKSIILCGTGADTSTLREFAERGASTGAMVLLDEATDVWFLAEGAPPAVRVMKQIAEAGGGRITEVERGTLPICSAAADLASWMLLPAVDAAAFSLRQAGLTPRRSAPIVERLVQRTLRAYLKGGRRAWKPPERAEDQERFLHQMTALRDISPELAETMKEIGRLSLRCLGRSDNWIEEPRPAVRRAGAGG